MHLFRIHKHEKTVEYMKCSMKPNIHSKFQTIVNLFKRSESFYLYKNPPAEENLDFSLDKLDKVCIHDKINYFFSKRTPSTNRSALGQVNFSFQRQPLAPKLKGIPPLF